MQPPIQKALIQNIKLKLLAYVDDEDAAHLKMIERFIMYVI
jgi:hypothetical protein